MSLRRQGVEVCPVAVIGGRSLPQCYSPVPPSNGQSYQTQKSDVSLFSVECCQGLVSPRGQHGEEKTLPYFSNRISSPSKEPWPTPEFLSCCSPKSCRQVMWDATCRGSMLMRYFMCSLSMVYCCKSKESSMRVVTEREGWMEGAAELTELSRCFAFHTP